MCVTHVPSPQAHAPNKVQHVYTGPMDSPLAQDMVNCDPDVSILILHYTLLFNLINIITSVALIVMKIFDNKSDFEKKLNFAFNQFVL